MRKAFLLGLLLITMCGWKVEQTHPICRMLKSRLLMARKFLLLSFVIFVIANRSIAQSQANTLVLVPVFFAGPGALGSFWNSQLTILNNSDKPLTSIPYIYSCPIPEGCLGAVPAHASLAFTAGAPNCPACFPFSTGFFYNVRSDELPQAVFVLRIFDETQAVLDYGTEIPVVTAAAFRESELQLLDVPTDPNFRISLRVYALPGPVPSVRVRIFQEPPSIFGFPQPSSVLVAERSLSLVAPPQGPSATIHGPSIVVNNPLDAQSATNGSRYRLTVQSATLGVPVWALLTVTNNQTQRVAAIVPQ
jgi:hypothetical protein